MDGMPRSLLVAVLALAPMTFASAASINWHFDPNSLDLRDLNDVRNNFGGAEDGDYTEDGIVNLDDLNYVRNRFGAPDMDPPSWVNPERPTVNDEIRYYLDYGGGVNACWATIDAGGTPYLVIDEARQAVEVGFDGSSLPGLCADAEDPRRGLFGDFGPLPAGHWTLGIAGQTPLVEFEVVEALAAPEPGTAAIALASLFACALGMRRARSRRAK